MSDTGSAVPDLNALASRLNPWGRCRVVSQLEGGHRNAVFLVERAGECLVAKTTRRSPSAISWLARVQQKAAEAGFVIPFFVPSERGRLVENGITVEKWIAGSPASHEHREQALPFLRAFHGATRSWPQRPGFASTLELLHTSSGGDVDLESMPDDLIARCRSAWSALIQELVSAVHGDLNAQNTLRTEDGKLALIDWDEARVDVSIMDEVALTLHQGPPDLPTPRWEKAIQALEAWEVAACWNTEPEYARRLAAKL